MKNKTYKGEQIRVERNGNRDYTYYVGTTFKAKSMTAVKDYINNQIEARKCLYAE